MKKKKHFRVAVTLTTSAEVKDTDIKFFDDDVVDGYSLSRNDRLGNPVSEFHLTELTNFEISEIKKNEQGISPTLSLIVIQENYRGLSRKPIVTQNIDVARAAVNSILKELHGNDHRMIRPDEALMDFFESYDEWLRDQSYDSGLHVWLIPMNEFNATKFNPEGN